MRILKLLAGIGLGYLLSATAWAHGIVGEDQAFILNNVGAQIGPYIYLGAKHMVTGYDHLLFLAGVIFFLYRLKDVALYVTLIRHRPQFDATPGRAGRVACQRLHCRCDYRALGRVQGVREPRRLSANSVTNPI